MWIRKQLWRFCAILCGLSVLLLAACGASGVGRQLTYAEQDALISIYKETDGDHWLHNDNWKYSDWQTDDTGSREFSPPECEWYGVICDADNQHVVGIDLHDNNLKGQLPLVPDLTELKSVDVRGNPNLDISLWISGRAPSSVTFLY